MYYILLIIIAVLLFLLRKRIFGGIVGVISLVLVIGLTIFMLDFFWLGKTYKGDDRDVRNFEPTQGVVEQYDEVIEDPVKKAQQVGEGLRETGANVNETLVETGSKLDERLGIQKETNNNNLWSESDGEESEGEMKHESESNQELEEEVKKGFIEKLSKGKSETEEDGETETQSTNQNKSFVTFDQVNRAESTWGLSKEDARFVKSASPFNLGVFSNGSITIEVVKEGVILK